MSDEAREEVEFTISISGAHIDVTFVRNYS